MRRRSTILGALLLLAASGAACSLNPQPFPPATLNGELDAGATFDASAPAPDASGGSDSGLTTDGSSPDGDAGDAGGDASSDAGVEDAGGDGGDAATPSDAALAEGG